MFIIFDYFCRPAGSSVLDTCMSIEQKFSSRVWGSGFLELWDIDKYGGCGMKGYH